VKIPLGEKTLQDSTYFMLKDSNNLAILIEIFELFSIILEILKGMGINFFFLFLLKKKCHVLYYLHNSKTKNLSQTNPRKRMGLPFKTKESYLRKFFIQDTYSHPHDKIHGLLCHPI